MAAFTQLPRDESTIAGSELSRPHLQTIAQRDSLEFVVCLGDGRYAACYTVPDRQGFTAYAKLYAFEPESAWDARGAQCKVAAGPLSTAEAALEAVLERAGRLATTRS